MQISHSLQRGLIALLLGACAMVSGVAAQEADSNGADGKGVSVLGTTAVERVGCD